LARLEFLISVSKLKSMRFVTPVFFVLGLGLLCSRAHAEEINGLWSGDGKVFKVDRIGESFYSDCSLGEWTMSQTADEISIGTIDWNCGGAKISFAEIRAELRGTEIWQNQKKIGDLDSGGPRISNSGIDAQGVPFVFTLSAQVLGDEMNFEQVYASDQGSGFEGLKLKAILKR
jgi:hypothetical protein